MESRHVDVTTVEGAEMMDVVSTFVEAAEFEIAYWRAVAEAAARDGLAECEGLREQCQEWMRRAGSLGARAHEANNRLRDADRSLAELRGGNAYLRAEVDRLAGELEVSRNSEASLRGAVKAGEEAIAHLQSCVGSIGAQWEARWKEARDELDREREHSTRLGAQVDAAQTAAAEACRDRDAALVALRGFDDQLASKEAQWEARRADLEARISDLEIAPTAQELVRLRNDRDYFRESRDAQYNDKRAAQLACADATRDRDAARAANRELVAEIERLGRELEAARATGKALFDAHAEAQRELERERAERDAARASLGKVREILDCERKEVF